MNKYAAQPEPAHTKPSRRQRTAITSGILGLVLILVMLQLWLLTATMNAFLGGDAGVLIPAAAASTVCLLLNLGLLRFLLKLESPDAR